MLVKLNYLIYWYSPNSAIDLWFAPTLVSCVSERPSLFAVLLLAMSKLWFKYLLLFQDNEGHPEIFIAKFHFFIAKWKVKRVEYHLSKVYIESI